MFLIRSGQGCSPDRNQLVGRASRPTAGRRARPSWACETASHPPFLGGEPTPRWWSSDDPFAPIPDLPALTPERGGSTLKSHSGLHRRMVGSAGSCRSLWVFTSLRQIVQQRLRLSQIGGVEPLGEPAVNRRQQIVSFDAPTLLAP